MATQAPKQPGQISIAREHQLIRLLMAYLAVGLFFMVLPGTFLGVWNLFAITNAQSATSIPAAWIQAHGHAQIFGWVGSFILGIGFYSLPNLRKVSAWTFWDGWLIWGLWTAGVGLRWVTNVYLWQWRVMLPLSACFEFVAVTLFVLRSFQAHGMQRSIKQTVEPWSRLVIAGTFGLLAATGFNLCESFVLAQSAATPAFPLQFDGSFLFLSVWGFIVPIAWGFTTHWMPVFLGLKPLRQKAILFALAADIFGVLAAVFHSFVLSTLLLLVASAAIVIGLRLFEKPDKPAKTQGVHPSFPLFMRIAYVWLLIASVIAIWSAVVPDSVGIGGAGRHALTVGFIMTMVFTVGPRMLPAFLGKKKLFSEALMLVALVLTNSGCLLRVPSEILSYQNYLPGAWVLLPVSATLELLGVLVFTANMIGTFRQPPLLASSPLYGSAKL